MGRIGSHPVHSGSRRDKLIPTLSHPKRVQDGTRSAGECGVIFLLNGGSMASSAINPGVLVTLQDLQPSSPFFKDGASLRVTGKLTDYSVETGNATIVDGSFNLKIDTQHLRDLNILIGSIYQFIGELLITPDNEAILQARVGRNVDGMDLNLYQQSLLLLRQFQADHTSHHTT